MINLREAKETDLPIITDLAHKIWPSTYQAYLSQQQIDYMLHKMYNHTTLLQQLNEGHRFLIAQQDTEDVGFAAFAVLEPETQLYKLHKLYVLPQTQGKGTGKHLLTEVINRAKKEGAKAIQLNVNRYNNAQLFYQKMGFIIKETIDLDIGDGFLMNDYVMELAL